MSPNRGALATLSPNHELDNAYPSASQLYPIFRTKSERVSSTPKPRRRSLGQLPEKALSSTGEPSKRARVSLGQSSSVGRGSIAHYFAPCTPLRAGVAGPSSVKEAAPVVVRSTPNVWRRQRRRLGQQPPRDIGAPHAGPTFLTTLATSSSNTPHRTPCNITLPSLSSAMGDRDHDPALVVTFNNAAKILTAEEARATGRRRLLAIGGEEGAIRVLDVDQPLNSGAPDHWWGAHNNGIFDLKWTAGDDRLLSASADQSIKIHDLNNGRPQQVATLLGHTSTIKSVTLMDTSRTSNTPSQSNIVVSGGRDGNIHLYDLRCPGNSSKAHDGPSGRTRRNHAAPVDISAGIGPVLTLKQPHNVSSSRRSSVDSRSVSRTITSLVALQSMPGILASGGSFDGVVKLWDVRMPAPVSSQRPKATAAGELPDPTVTGENPSRRPRSVNALCEDPRTGDLYTLCGDSQIHVLRPSAAQADNPLEAIMPYKYAHPDLLTRSFYIRMSISSDGRYLACGSSHAGVMTWDTDYARHTSTICATRLAVPSVPTPEVIAVDWGKDMLSASSDDGVTRIWRPSFGLAP
ncbi:WD40 repeat-like protein [Cutaneotrichosporon oleaginosum]|uniref:WD40 repeat-like protein n=1 Tax=Cutaneotrichosporon oleaginosum TaxID=879819 RepID=A0A0J1BDT4_9TREE|nr:WD40 repeat-like protein [Cutaneotrichosporon oleaginosum]KLT46234.1 WD40 repeat-like protein [Cutaneotrichosporon oleaginosum]TXT10240.1 hypothetical protein COLE_04174 [Cutaneotrichosporon oleaginosum]